MRLCTFILALAVSEGGGGQFRAAPHQENGGPRLAWKSREGEVYVYDCSDPASGQQVNDRVVVFSCELKNDGSNSIACRGPRDIPIVLLFTLPGKTLKRGDTWAFQRDWFTRPIVTETALLVPRVRVIGKLRVSDTKADLIEIVGAFSVMEGQYRKSEWIPDSKPLATIETFQQVDSRLGKLVEGRFTMTGTVRECASVPQGIHVRSQQVRMSRRLELQKETLGLDEAVLRPRIDAAVLKGREWLAKQQQADGRFPGAAGGYWVVSPTIGPTAHALLALLHSGIKPDDPGVKRAWIWIVEKSHKMRGEFYDVSLLLMALEARYLSAIGITEEDVLKKPPELSLDDKALLQKWASWLSEAVLKPLPDQFSGHEWDHPVLDLANTHYAALGLRSAARCGYSVRPAIWKTLLRRVARVPYMEGTPVILDLQPPSGSKLTVEAKADSKTVPGTWGYLSFRGFGPMKEAVGNAPSTCAALTALSICHTQLHLLGQSEADDQKRAEEALRQGWASIQMHYSVRGAFPEAGSWAVWHLYYLWGLERASTFCNIQKLGGHDWYLEGAAYLLGSQRAEGYWTSFADVPTTDTAFALLFLKRWSSTTSTKSGR